MSLRRKRVCQNTTASVADREQDKRSVLNLFTASVWLLCACSYVYKRVNALVAFICFPHLSLFSRNAHFFIWFFQAVGISSRCVFRQAPAMDERTAKRYASVQHIKQKPYYRPGIEDPNPFETCPTRAWRYKMKVWVVTLKTVHQDQLPQQENPAHDVTAGSQSQ